MSGGDRDALVVGFLVRLGLLVVCIGHNYGVIVSGECVRKRGRERLGIALARVQVTGVPGFAQQDGITQRGWTFGEIDRVTPYRGVGGTRAQVDHGPVNGERLAGGAVQGGGDARDLQVCIAIQVNRNRCAAGRVIAQIGFKGRGPVVAPNLQRV